jgi:hypothetical protein
MRIVWSDLDAKRHPPPGEMVEGGGGLVGRVMGWSSLGCERSVYK